jgi:hypothetical protein
MEDKIDEEAPEGHDEMMMQLMQLAMQLQHQAPEGHDEMMRQMAMPFQQQAPEGQDEMMTQMARQFEQQSWWRRDRVEQLQALLASGALGEQDAGAAAAEMEAIMEEEMQQQQFIRNMMTAQQQGAAPPEARELGRPPQHQGNPAAQSENRNEAAEVLAYLQSRYWARKRQAAMAGADGASASGGGAEAARETAAAQIALLNAAEQAEIQFREAAFTLGETDQQ